MWDEADLSFDKDRFARSSFIFTLIITCLFLIKNHNDCILIREKYFACWSVELSIIIISIHSVAMYNLNIILIEFRFRNLHFLTQRRCIFYARLQIPECLELDKTRKVCRPVVKRIFSISQPSQMHNRYLKNNLAIYHFPKNSLALFWQFKPHQHTVLISLL